MGKKKTTVVINYLEDVDAVLQRIGERRREIAVAEADANEKLEDIRSALLDKTAVARFDLEQNEVALEAWARENKKLFVKPRSLDLNWGESVSVGHRGRSSSSAA